MTASTSGYSFPRRFSISPASRVTAARTWSALAIGSEFSRSAQAFCASGIFSRLEIASEVLADLGVAHAVLDACLQIAELGAAIEAPPGQPHRQHALVREQRRDCVGQLDLAARARHNFAEQVEDARREHVAADHPEVGRRLCGL